MVNVEVTKKQQETLDAIRRLTDKSGKSPTLEELRNELGLGSHQTVADRVELLIHKGLLRRKSSHSSRGLEVVEKSYANKQVTIPVVMSAGCDDMSVFAQEEYDQYLHVEEPLLRGHRDVVAIKAIGNSMVDAGVYDGDYIFVDTSENQPANGSLVVAIYDGMAILKRYTRDRNGQTITLSPESNDAKYKPLVIDANSDLFSIVGTLVCVLPYGEDDDIITVEYDDQNHRS